MQSTLNEKIETLTKRLRDMQSVIVAFSAGVDSTYLAAMAQKVLGERALAVTATSPSFPERELDDALALMHDLGIRHRIIRSHELANPNYANNPTNRCYHCKTELYGLLRSVVAEEEQIQHVVDGMNLDDEADFRPGKKAAIENGIESPLRDAGFTKADIREASAAMGLRTADKPAFACLASRFAYGEPISAVALKQVEQAENALRDLGFNQLRVRVPAASTARIEFAPADVERAATEPLQTQIIRLVEACGFESVTIDPRGYRRGSMNEVFKRLQV